MKTVLSAILKFIAFILAGILILAIPLSLLAYNLGDSLFNQEEVNQIVAGVFLDSDIVPATMEIITNRQAEEISQKIEDTEQPEGQELDLFTLVYSMEESNWINFRAALLSDHVIGQWIQVTVNGFYNWLDSDEKVPQIRWNMKPLIEQMGGQEGQEAIVAFYDSLPDCTDLQMEEMKTQPGDPVPRAKMVKELCKLSTFPHAEQIVVYSDVMQLVIKATPPEFNATQSFLKSGEESINGMYTLKWNLRRLRATMAAGLLIPIGLLFLILLFGVRSMESLGQWWGIPLVGGSLITLISALLYKPLWTGILTDRMPEAIPQTSLLYHEIIEGSARVLSPVFNPLRWQSFLLLLVGVGFLVMGFILRMRGSGEK
ncbi:MAG: hypothetical protein MUO54_05365 [Anaerolineales bacterium]|nr:hypothetical protein [Anaerolineales bacterium]